MSYGVANGRLMDLPTELLIAISLFLPIRDQISASQTCGRWQHILTETPEIQKTRYLTDCDDTVYVFGIHRFFDLNEPGFTTLRLTVRAGAVVQYSLTPPGPPVPENQNDRKLEAIVRAEGDISDCAFIDDLFYSPFPFVDENLIARGDVEAFAAEVSKYGWALIALEHMKRDLRVNFFYYKVHVADSLGSFLDRKIFVTNHSERSKKDLSIRELTTIIAKEIPEDLTNLSYSNDTICQVYLEIQKGYSILDYSEGAVYIWEVNASIYLPM
ncbi:hypothetical protein ABW20_dc0109746 [Dactylellina cionopaga]|nr:hypothetical protein ABW20_dc0109746 [Dactylellina cionopaga]